jgi:hypothetical protein
VRISTLADEAVGMTSAVSMHEIEQPAPAEIAGPVPAVAAAQRARAATTAAAPAWAKRVRGVIGSPSLRGGCCRLWRENP